MIFSLDLHIITLPSEDKSMSYCLRRAPYLVKRRQHQFRDAKCACQTFMCGSGLRLGEYRFRLALLFIIMKRIPGIVCVGLLRCTKPYEKGADHVFNCRIGKSHKGI